MLECRPLGWPASLSAGLERSGMSAFLKDVRYALRNLARTPAQAAIAILTLGLGIGANTAIFSVLNAVAFRTPPYPDPHQLVQVLSSDPSQDLPSFRLSGREVLEYRRQNQVLQALAGFRSREMDYRGGDEPLTLSAATVTAGFFQVLGFEPMLGRTFTAADEVLDNRMVVVLNHGFWRRQLSSDPNIVGKYLRFRRSEYAVIGVMPTGLRNPEGEGVDLWFPAPVQDSQEARLARWLASVARLKPGVDIERAQAEMDLISARLEEEYPETNAGWGVRLVPLRGQFSANIDPMLWVLHGVVFVILLMACCNVAALLLSRALARQREIAVRSALGSSRFRLSRLMLTESALLALPGGLLGLLLASWSVGKLFALLPVEPSAAEQVGLDGRILIFALGVSLLTALMVGLAPSLHAMRSNLNESLTESGATGTSKSKLLRSSLVVVELSLAVILLVGAGLLIRSFLNLRAVDVGFQSENLLTFGFRPDWARLDGRPDPAVYRQLLERLKTIQGVVRVGAVSRLPMTGQTGGWPVRAEWSDSTRTETEFRSDLKLVAGEYHRSLAIPLLEGRYLTEADDLHSPQVVVINQMLARHLWPNHHPIDKKVFALGRSLTVVGVVGDVRPALDEDPSPILYIPYQQLLGELQPSRIVLNTEADPIGLVDRVRSEASVVDPGMIINEIRSMEQIKAGFIAPRHSLMVLLGGFAAVALLLAAAGIYGVMSYAVSQRTQELGVRSVVGAEGGDLLLMVMGQTLKLVAAGLLAGLLGVLIFSRVLESQLWGVSCNDPITLLGVCLILVGTALAASFLPAWRATRINPAAALRYE